MTAPVPPRTGSKASQRLRSLRSRWGVQEMSPEDRRATLEQLFPKDVFGAYLNRFSTLLGLSALIAFCGLNANSTAVVIGAMLVAPLMEPILAMAGALVMSWRGRLGSSAALLAWGTFLTIAIAVVLGLLVPDRLVVPAEIVARTKPNLLDLGVALGAGTAGAYTLVKRVGVAAAGVAIAVALVPPLVVVGITLEEQRWAMAGGAFILFVTNLLAILLAAAVVFLLSGFSPLAIRQRAGRWITTGISTTVAGLVVIAVPLTIYTSVMFRTDLTRDAVFSSVDEWSGFLPQDVVGIGLQGDVIVLDLISEMDPPALRALANSVASRVGENVSVRIRWLTFEEREIDGVFRGKTKEVHRFRPRSFERLY